MMIEVLGSGCAKCHMLADRVKQAVSEAGIDAQVVHVTDIQQIIQRGVMMTPALVVDGKAVLQGKVPTVEQVKVLIGNKK